MRFWVLGLRAALFVAILAGRAGPTSATSVPYAPMPAAVRLAQEVLASADHGGLPFAVVDKKAATLTIFRGDGQLVATTPVLLGRATGDQATPGVGSRTQSRQLRLRDQVTTAGRFDSQPGHNLAGEAVVWIDYDSALAIHRLRPGASHQDRALRLAMADPRGRRVSAGCVVVPVAFYEAVVAQVLGRSRGVIYVMAEEGKPLAMPHMASGS
jgi:uncharacterized protein GlcG (DUF336 family)